MALEDFEAIFSEAKAEWSALNPPASRPFLFHAYALDPSRLKIDATDFHSSTWEAVRSMEQLEDMRDMTGIGGSWSEFIDYVVACLKSEGVKLVLEGQPQPEGAVYAKLIAQKAKGMPLISFQLTKLVDATAKEAMANMSMKLYGTYKSVHHMLIIEQERCCQLTKVISAEQEKSESIQRQLDSLLFTKRQKPRKMIEKANSGFHDSPDKLAAESLGPTKVPKQAVPAYRRAKVRGALLHDSPDGAEK